MTSRAEAPLAGIVVLDLVAGPMAAIGRTLAELGAAVTRIEPPGGAWDRPGPDDLDSGSGAELDFTALNAGKGCAVLDLASPGRARKDAARLDAMLGAAHLALVDIGPRAAFPLDPQALRARFPGLVVMSVGDFGLAGGRADWQGSDPVWHAMSSELARSGLAGRAPLIPPGRIAAGTAASHGAWLATLALYDRLRTGAGAWLDFSALDAAIHALDPPYGTAGPASSGGPPAEAPRDRPAAGIFYPIIACADGRVRICVQSPRQWQGLHRWMGSPAEFADPKFNLTKERYASAPLLSAIRAFMAPKTRAELEAEGGALGVPVAALLSLEEMLDGPHAQARGLETRVATPSGGTAALPCGVMEIDGARAGPAGGAPALGDAPAPGAAAAPAFPAPSAAPRRRPLEGLRVLDLGVIVVGADQGRLLADQGADVIKVEARAFPDGSRVAFAGDRMTVSFACAHRNKRSLGLNLRAEAGRDLFLRLAAGADVVLSNFKPGTMAKLGLGAEALFAVNPGIVQVDSSAYGPTGPWSERLGYGPLVRANAGLTGLWRYPDDPDGFADGLTIYPDHVGARVGATGALALLVRRLRTGRGGTVSVSQTEVMLSHLAPAIARMRAGLPAEGPEAAPGAPWGVFPTAGEDDWCAVTVRDDADWAALCALLGRDPEAGGLGRAAARRADPEAAEALLRAWLLDRTATEAMATLQAAGVPAGAMARVGELPTDPHLIARRHFRTAAHPLLPEPGPQEHAPVLSDRWADPDARPAPEAGEQTREVIADWLGLSAQEIDRLIAQDILEPAAAAPAAGAPAPS
ncbi:MAG: CoA transferase [Pseudomonadota bacterium]|nr:CoA transferase [Pseudomonadota bacterium]